MSHPQSSSAAFVTTRWSVVLAAGHGTAASSRQALEELCSAYWYPLYAYVRRRGHSPADAEDLVQGFFEQLLRLQSLGEVERGRGRFRSFLMASINHYIVDQWDKASAGKRDVRRGLSLDAGAAETRYQREPPDTRNRPPDREFERQWALALLENVIKSLADEYTQSGRGELFMKLRFAIAGDQRSVPYVELANDLGMPEPAVRVAVHRLRQRYRQALRQQIADTVGTPEEVDEELAWLFQALAG